MNKDNIEIYYQKLIDEIRNYQEEYYGSSASSISDEAYDALFEELKELERAHPNIKISDSPTNNVGGPKFKLFSPVTHIKPMLSLDNVFNLVELQDWIIKTKKNLQQDALTIVAEKKIDGLAMSLHYKNGFLFRAATRGDGVTGEDVTKNVFMINNIPKKLSLSDAPENLHIRGEVFFYSEDFQKVNDYRSNLGEKKFANPRNAASGSIRQKIDSKNSKDTEVAEFSLKHLSFKAHGIVYDNDDFVWSNLSQTYDSLKKLGFDISAYDKLTISAEQNIEPIKKLLNDHTSNRMKENYGIDGIVFKIDDLAYQQILGTNSRVPKWAIAYKFPPEEVVTVLRGIGIGVGRTGRATPYALLDTVLLDGTQVSRATLHNQDVVVQKNLLLGDKVIIRKAGDIIPEIVTSLPQLRNGSETSFVMPKNCPECGSLLRAAKTADVDLRCPNYISCPAQIRGRLEYLGSRKVLDVEGLGAETAALLVAGSDAHPALLSNNEGVISEAKLFSLTLEDLFSFATETDEGLIYPFRRKADKKSLAEIPDKYSHLNDNGYIPKKTAIYLIENLYKAKTKEFWRLLAALNIRHVGPVMAQTLASEYETLSDLEKASKEEISSVHGVGVEIAESVKAWLNESSNKKIIHEWQAAGVVFGTKRKDSGNDTVKNLFGYNIVVTGSLKQYTRESISEEIRKHGAKPVSSVSKNTDILVAGENAGSKLAKAIELGIAVIDESEFEQLIAIGPEKYKNGELLKK